MWTRLEVFQRLDSRFRGNDKQGGNDEGDAFPWSPYPKPGLFRDSLVLVPQQGLKEAVLLSLTVHSPTISLGLSASRALCPLLL